MSLAVIVNLCCHNGHPVTMQCQSRPLLFIMTWCFLNLYGSNSDYEVTTQ